jgi:ubiquinone/menaquinone biosynthesis C-methylase UbiE
MLFIMNEFEIMIDFYKHIPRQGPGSSTETLKALDLTGISKNDPIRIADIGCGTGAQTLTLAENTNSHITAVDLYSDFLEKLNEKAILKGFQDRIETDEQSMDGLPYDDMIFDLIWSEGAIYIMGFLEGVKAWGRLLKDKGILVVSEISWFSESRPEELETYWNNAYPQMDTIVNKVMVLKKNGYKVLASFKIPEYCWIKNYYQPIQEYFPRFLEHHGNSPEARNFVDEMHQEIEMFERFREYYGYAFYIAQKNS